MCMSYVKVFVHIHVHIPMHAHIHVHTYGYVYVKMVCVRVFVCVCTGTYVHGWTCMHIYLTCPTTYLLACFPPYVPTAYLLVCLLPACLPTYLPADVGTFVRKYVHACAHMRLAYLHTFINFHT